MGGLRGENVARARRAWLAAWLAVLAGGAPAAAGPTPEELDRAITSAGGYLASRLSGEGRFEYIVLPDYGIHQPRTPEYNALRHAGTIYALGQLQKRTPSVATRDAIRRAAAYLERRHLRAPTTHPELLAIFSDPAEEGVRGPAAKLGGAGLALLAFATAHEVGVPSASIEQMQRLGEFIRFAQEDNGHFRSRYHEDTGFDESFESLYYPGEAILGLLWLHRLAPDPRWIEVAAKGAGYLVASRRGQTELPADHWLMLAAWELMPHYERLESPPVPPAELRAHIETLGRIMLGQQAAVTNPRLRGSFNPVGRSTPSATRLEGLLSLHRLMESAGQEGPVFRALEVGVPAGIQFLLRCQVRDGPFGGGVVAAIDWLPNLVEPGVWKSIPPSRRPGPRDHLEIRIDYVQHALSAWIAYEAQFCTSTACR